MRLDFPTVEIKEGKARLLVPDLEALREEPSTFLPSRAPVFYNPRMVVNRDVAVLFLHTYQKSKQRNLNICEPMMGCGVRGIRFASEVEGIGEVVINDLSERAFELSRINVEKNRLRDRILVRNMDASLLLSVYAAPRRRFDYIDIDPFGSPAPYMESSIRALRDGGALALTATDTAPLSGLHSRVCLRRYFGRSLRVEYWKEIAVRLVMAALVWSSSRYDVAVKPILAYGADHYIRLYATVHHGARAADRCIEEVGFILHCSDCLHREPVKILRPFNSVRCPKCGSRMGYAGPLWLGGITDTVFCDLMLANLPSMDLAEERQITKLLNLLRGEAEAPQTYYVTDHLGRRLGKPLPPLDKVLSELRSRGYASSRTHFHSRGFKTEAPSDVVLKVVGSL